MNDCDIPAVYRILRQEYVRHRAPVVDLIRAQTDAPFCVLVATILSARTLDQTTAAACERLFASVREMDDLRRLPEDRLAALIYPVGFYRTKARHLKELPGAVDREFGGTLPSTVDELCRLPGVGRKTANLVVAMGFGKPAICVDVHVHRISNRLGLVATRRPHETEMALRGTLPVRYWRFWNSCLVSHGQRVCTPRRPCCSRCRLSRYCPRRGVTDPR